MSQFSKLQIRAKVLAVITEIKSQQYRNEEFLLDLSEKLNEIEDKNALFDIFIKEYIKLEEDDYIFCSCLLKNIIPANIITEKSMEILKSSMSDEYKYKLVQLLRITGGDYNYSELPEYFENPQEVMDLETKRLLDSAVFNPESMLDFLDFVSAVSERDKSLLLKSLNIDYKGDVLANIVYPVLYSDFEDNFKMQAIEVLSESKSSLAIAPFEYLIKTCDNEEIVTACKKGLKMLKLAGATPEKADEYFRNIVKTSVPAQFFVTMPDGSGKQALLTTRKHDNGKYSLAAVVISDLTGIIDCFGFFNIAQEEVIKVIKKFYNSEGQYTVPAKYVRYMLNYAEKINIDKKIMYPYEYICWKPMVYDVEPLEISLKDYADLNCKVQQFSPETIINLMATEYTFRWFITPSENKVIRKITEDIYSFDNIDIKVVNQMLKDNADSVFDNETMNIWENRFYSLIYILRLNNKLKEADNFYTILKDENSLQLFKYIILQRSVFNYFVALRENTKESFFTKNIFKKRSANENKYDIKKINKIIITLKGDWIDR